MRDNYSVVTFTVCLSAKSGKIYALLSNSASTVDKVYRLIDNTVPRAIFILVNHDEDSPFLIHAQGSLDDV